jgi:hypothetical protein
LAAQYISNGGVFSHQVKAANIDEAILKLSYKIQMNFKNDHHSVGNHRCVAFNHCPNRINCRKPNSEVYFRVEK